MRDTRSIRATSSCWSSSRRSPVEPARLIRGSIGPHPVVPDIAPLPTSRGESPLEIELHDRSRKARLALRQPDAFHRRRRDQALPRTQFRAVFLGERCVCADIGQRGSFLLRPLKLCNMFSSNGWAWTQLGSGGSGPAFDRSCKGERWSHRRERSCNGEQRSQTAAENGCRRRDKILRDPFRFGACSRQCIPRGARGRVSVHPWPVRLRQVDPVVVHGGSA